MNDVSNSRGIPGLQAGKDVNVILLVPDYAASTFGQDIYTAHAKGEDLRAAIADARRQAEEAYPHHDIEDPEDFHHLASFEGHLDPLSL